MNTLNLNIPGFSIACKTWGHPGNPPIVALHGWLDNANSFLPLASYLEHEFYLVAVELPGHGHSSHIPIGSHYHFFDGIFIVMAILHALNFDKVHLLGHSMGACLASLLGGIMPERFLSLTLIEGLGPFSHPEETACQQLRKYAHFITQKSKKPKSYDHLESAALARACKGYVSLDIAKILCERSLIEKSGKLYWRHDPRLLIQSPLRMTENQILSCLEEITAKTYLLIANQGFSFDAELVEHRSKAVKNLVLKKIDGGHHVHMEKPDVIGHFLIDFIQNT